MVGTGGALEVLLVTAVAGRVGDAVIVVDVTIGALARGHGVHSREGESGVVVVKRRVHPVAGVVALLASLGEIGGDVVGIAGALEIGQVATHTSRVGDGVVIVHVAIGALPRRYRVGSGQREPGLTVIKLTVGPLDRIVTVLTGCWPTH